MVSHPEKMLPRRRRIHASSSQVVVTSAAWPQREAFLEQIRAGFRSLPPRYVYYPGSKEKLAAFQKCDTSLPHRSAPQRSALACLR